MRERGLEYEDRRVDLDDSYFKELWTKYRSAGTPTFEIDGQVLVGFNPERLQELLG